MTHHDSTAPPSSGSDAGALRRPGALVVFGGGAPRHHIFELPETGLELGRGPLEAAGLADRRVSRRHVTVRRDGTGFTVEDHGSRNGTFLDGQRLAGKAGTGPALLRLGDTLLLLVAELEPHAVASVVEHDGMIVGAATRAALERVRHAARTADTVLFQGESGVGKELAARTFHREGPHADGPFIAVNCAAIPEGLAERLLFGTVRGAYSGAVAAPGYLEAAAGGVLFLDEIGELHPAVQAKLLRAIEAREVLPLGATEVRHVNTRVCCATLTNLHAAVTAGRFRGDLYYRLARRVVSLPPLRQRRDEIPWLAAAETRRVSRSLVLHPNLVEWLLLQPWPGNVRELVSVVRGAAEEATLTGATVVEPAHLAAGQVVAPPSDGAPRREPTGDEVRAVIASHAGNLSAVARALGLHRSQLYRLLRKLDIPTR